MSQTQSNKAPLTPQAIAAVTSKWMVPMKTSGNRPPFFFLGEYLDVGRHFSKDQPYYALLLAMDVRTFLPGMSFADIAALVIKEIKKVQPQGPYYLGGYCFSAALVFEAALQLRAAGEEIAYFAIVEPQVPESINPPPFPKLNGLSYRLKKLNWKMLANPFARISHSIALRKESARLAALGLDGDRPVSDFVPRKLDVTVDAFLCVKSPDRIGPDTDRRLAWSKFATRLVHHELPGDHLSILREPLVRTFVPLLEKRLQEAQAKRK